MQPFLLKCKETLDAKREKGFTLMELLIVIAIIAVLVAIAIPVFKAQLYDANKEVDEANIRSGYMYLQSDLAMKQNRISQPTTYYLKDDGTTAAVTAEAASNPYIVKGIGTDVPIAGMSVSWGESGQIYITYTVKEDNGVYKITSVQGASSVTTS